MAAESTAVVPAVHKALRPRTETLDLLVYWRAIARRKWMILGVAALIAIGTAAWVSTITPIYRSTATVLIEQNRAKVAPTEDLVENNVGDSREHLQTQAEVLKSRTLALRLVEKLNLTRHPDFDPRQQEKPLFERMKQQLGLGAETSSLTEDEIHKFVVGSLMSRTTVEPVRLSQLVRVSFESSDPMTAAIIANAIAEAYIESDVQARQQMNQRASEWLGGRLGGLRRNVEDSERALQQYREQARIVETRGLAQSGATRQVEDLMSRLIAARQRRIAAESAQKQAGGSREQQDVLPVVLRNPQVDALRELETEAERRVNELSNRYGPDHPRMMQAQAELRQARSNTRRQVETVVASLGNELELARANEQALERALGEAKGGVQRINRKEFELASLERAVATNRQIYEVFLNRFRETKASRDLQSGAVARLADPARPADRPIKPRVEQSISIAFVLGLLLGGLIALLLERLDNTLKSAEDIEEKLGQPMLSMLPLLKSAEAANIGRHYLDDPRSVFSEAIRTVRTGVQLSASGDERLALLVTSSVPGEGKTAVAVNLALAYAQAKRVLLIDADLRRPSVSQALGLEAGKPGLTDLLSGAATFAQCLQRVPGSALFAIASGPVPLNPLEMILSQRFQQLMRALAGTCDVLIIDTPPVHLVSDAVVLATMTSGVVFVAKADATPYPLARRCLRSLEEAEARVFGVALNQLDFKKAARYYGAYVGSYYTYDGYYTRSAKELKRPQPTPALTS